MLYALLAVLGGLLCAAAGADPAFPLRPSPDGRYLVDARGRPFLYHADTAWNLPKKLTLAEAEEYLDDRKARGFTAIQIQAVSKEQGPMTNRAGHYPFEPPDDILRPVEAYWRHLDKVLEAARKRGFFVAVAPLWIRWGGDDREGWRYQLTEENARSYGRWLGERYGHLKNLMWILGGDANPTDRKEAIRLLAAGLKEAAPDHLLTYHGAPENSSASLFGEEKWLDVNLAYTYREVPAHVLPEWRRKPARPILLGESGYEEESNDGRGGSAWRARRQAYGALLSGALAGHAFGQKHLWRCDPEWRKALDSPGSRQMSHLARLFASRPWYSLVPDAGHELVVEGHGPAEEIGSPVAARASDGSLALIYLPTPRSVTVDLSRLTGKQLRAWWFNPRDGRTYDAEGRPSTGAFGRLEPGGRWVISPPSAGEEDDWLLVLEDAGRGWGPPGGAARAARPR